MIKSTYCSSMEVQYVNQFLGCFNNGREYRISRGTGAENELETILKRMYEVYKAGLIGYELDVKGYFYQMVSAMLRNGYILSLIHILWKVDRSMSPSSIHE